MFTKLYNSIWDTNHHIFGLWYCKTAIVHNEIIFDILYRARATIGYLFQHDIITSEECQKLEEALCFKLEYDFWIKYNDWSANRRL